MPIDAKSVQWDAPDPNAIEWDDARPVVQQSESVQPELQDSSFVADAKRGLGLGARDVYEGLSGTLGGVADLAAFPVNAGYRLVTGNNNDLIPSYRQSVSNAADAIGLPKPATTTERVISSATRGVASVPVGVGTGRLLATASNPVVAGVGNTLQAAPGAQAAAAGSAGASGQLAAEAGVGPAGQAVASLAGGVVGGGAASALTPKAAPTLESTLPSGARTGAAKTPASSALSQEGRTQEYINSVKALQKAGVPLTAGQRSGTNWVKSSERTLSEVPFSGKPLQGVFERQNQAYQKKLLSLAGNARGDKMITRQTLENTADDLSKQYAEALGGKSVNISDDAFLSDLAAIEAKHSQFVDTPTKNKVSQIVNSFLEKSAGSNTVTGEWYQAQRSLFAKRAMKNTEVADLYGDLKNVLDDAFARSAGNVKGNLDSRYARYKQLLDIYNRNGGPAASEGFISPVAVARQASGAPGGKEWQDFTRAAAAVLPDRLGNSGTAQRNFILGLAGGSVPIAYQEPLSLAVTGGTALAARGMSNILSAQPSAGISNPILTPSILGIANQSAAQNILLRNQ